MTKLELLAALMDLPNDADMYCSVNGDLHKIEGVEFVADPAVGGAFAVFEIGEIAD